MLPGRLFRALVRGRIRGALEPVRRAGASADAGSMERILRASMDTLDPAALIRYNDWMIESLRAFRFAPADLAGRAADVLIVESADDPILPASSRAALRTLYPAARVHTFHGGGHATALAMPAEYAAIVTGFLDGAPVPA
jgi:pimeloyl-ACP methyl ester carboxylesterase